jgi:hypothetical protein
MSSYWQGKGAGKKIAVRFDKPLLGDVAGNETAFTVTGMVRNPLKYGPLVERTFTVESVERYPLERYWRDEFEGDMDGVEVGENGLVLEESTAPMNILATFTDVGSDTFTVPAGVTSVNALIVAGGGGGGSRQGGGGGAGGVILETGIAVTPEDEIDVTVGGGGTGGTSGGRGTNGGNSVFDELTAIGGGGGGGRTTDPQGASGGSGGGGGYQNAGGSGEEGQGRAGGDSFTNNGGGGGGYLQDGQDGSPTNNTGDAGTGGNGFDGSLIFGTEIGASGWFAGGGGGGAWRGTPGAGGQGGGGNGAQGDPVAQTPQNGTANTGGGGGGSGATGTAGGNGGSGIVIIFTGGGDAFPESGTYTPPPIPTAELPADPRIRIEANTPEDTSITVEYACTADDETPPESWTAVDDEDTLTINDDYLWLRYTLETEDTSKTPTLLAVWLEEAEAPPDTILLTMTPDSRFNDVEGDLTVSYEREKGTLTGTRPVEDFTESFTPTGLEPTPLNVQGTITAGIEVAVDLIEVDYRYFKDDSADHIITAGITVDVALIPVSEIPP